MVCWEKYEETDVYIIFFFLREINFLVLLKEKLGYPCTFHSDV